MFFIFILLRSHFFPFETNDNDSYGGILSEISFAYFMFIIYSFSLLKELFCLFVKNCGGGVGRKIKKNNTQKFKVKGKMAKEEKMMKKKKFFLFL